MELSPGEDLAVAWGSEPDEAITGLAMAFGSQYDVEWKRLQRKEVWIEAYYNIFP